MRRPSDLRRYITWTTAIKAEYGSITNFVCQKRLRWQPDLIPNNSLSNGTGTTTDTENPTPTSDHKPTFSYRNPTPFADPSDYKILRNDWPYGVEPGISHLVIWLRTPIEVTEGGYMTDASRELIQRYVDATFVERLEKEGFKDAAAKVLWFKNWTGLQSVRTLEHVHILLKDVPEKLLFEWTGEGPPETALGWSTSQESRV